MLKIKCDINQQDLKRGTSVLSNRYNFHSLEVVDRVSQTQLQVGERGRGILVGQTPVQRQASRIFVGAKTKKLVVFCFVILTSHF